MRVLVPLDIKDSRQDSERSVVATTDKTSIYSTLASGFRSMKLVVQTTLGSTYSVRELLAIHDGLDGFVTEYAIISTDDESDIVDDFFSVGINSGNFHLYVEPSTAASRTFIVSVTLV